jgi:pyruvate kinase
MRRTKIVGTIGPACETLELLRQLVEAGLNVARLNFSHATHEWHAERIRLLRQLEAEIGTPIAILQDLSGPKVRVGELPPEGIDLQNGMEVVLTAEPVDAAREPRSDRRRPAAGRRSSNALGDEGCAATPSAAVVIPLPVPPLLAALKPGDQLFLDDGLIELVVEAREGAGVRCRVVEGGLLTSHKGVTARGVAFDIPAVTKRDLEDLRFGIAHQVDWVALSYVRRARDLEPVLQAMAAAGVAIPIIAKIEKQEAVEYLDELLEAADGIMVARGDLGVEMPIHEVPVIQKEIIRRCNRTGKPVITATQMLDSMIRNPRPTRAEVSDVANAIIDGTDAVMLSGETAQGAYPVAAVQMMDRIARRTERALDFPALLAQHLRGPALSITDAISQGACEIAADLCAAAILASTTSGQTARMISRNRPESRIVGATANPATYRQLALCWGVHPVLCAPTHNTDEMLREAVERALEAGLIRPGDTVVISAGVPVGVPGNTNLIKVQRV